MDTLSNHCTYCKLIGIQMKMHKCKSTLQYDFDFLVHHSKDTFGVDIFNLVLACLRI